MRVSRFSVLQPEDARRCRRSDGGRSAEDNVLLVAALDHMKLTTSRRL